MAGGRWNDDSSVTKQLCGLDLLTRFAASHKRRASPGFQGMRCERSGCMRQPIYSRDGQRPAIRCSSHADRTMINIYCPRCEAEGCSVVSVFNFPGSKRGARCSAHRLPNDVNVRGRPCQHEGCTIRPSFNYPNLVAAVRCSGHKRPGMVHKGRERWLQKNAVDPSKHGNTIQQKNE